LGPPDIKPGAGAFQSAGLFIRTSAFYFFKKYRVSCIAAVANCADYVKRIFRGKIIAFNIISIT